MTRTLLVAVSSFCLGAGLAAELASVVEAQDRKTESRELLRVDLGEWCPGKEVVVTHLTNGTGSTGRHSHPAHSFSYVIEGAQTVSPDGKPPHTARAGDMQYEAPYAISATRTMEPSKVLTVRILEKGKPATIPAAR